MRFVLPLLLLLAAPAANAAPPEGCVPVSERCVIGKGERMIDGFRVARDCWEKRVVYACPDAHPGGPCLPLSDHQGCSRTGAECVERDGDDVCLRERNTFRCRDRIAAPGVTLENTVAAAPMKDVDQPLQCGSALYCPDGNCDDESPPNADFGKAASWMGLLTRMGAEKDADAASLFRGERRECERWPWGTKNCCTDKGWLMDAFGCSEEEKTLARQTASRLTVAIGEYCSDKAFLVGCVTRKRTYCAFRSKFARILQVQARAQLGVGWGGAESPDCRSLTLDEIRRVDFSRIDLSELYGDMLGSARVPDPAAVNAGIKARIEDYYRERR